MEISELKSGAILFTRYYTIQKILKTFKCDTVNPCGYWGCKTTLGQSLRSEKVEVDPLFPLLKISAWPHFHLYFKFAYRLFVRH